MSDQFLLFVGDAAWRAGAVREGAARVEPVMIEGEATLDSLVSAAKESLGRLGHCGEPILVAVPSSWCLCATISTQGLDRSGRRRAMAFRLEEHLPVSAEEIVADFVEVGGGQALGVCAEMPRLSATVAAIEACGLPVAHICPASLLAAAHVIDRHPDVQAVLEWRGDRPAARAGATNPRHREAPAADAGYDLLELRKGKLLRWWCLADDVAALRRRVAAWAATCDPPAKLATAGCEEADLPFDPGEHDVELQRLKELTGDQAAALAAAQVLSGVAVPWVDLRRDALAAPDQHQVLRTPLAALAAAAVFLLLAVIAVSQWRGRAYGTMARQTASQQIDVFKSAFPHQRPPVSIKGRLQSDKQKLVSLSGQAAGDAGLLSAPSALEHLRAVLAALSADLRFRVLDLSVQADLIRIDGQARTRAEAERIALALRQAGLREVQPPKTQAIATGGVSFLFTARPPVPATTARSSAAVAAPADPATSAAPPAAAKGGRG